MSNRLLSILILIWFIWVWYVWYKQSYTPKKNIEIKQEINEKIIKQQEKKQVNLEKQDKVEQKIDPKKKIQELREKKMYYKTFFLKDDLKVYFKERENSLDLYLNKKLIWTFDLLEKNSLRVDAILWTDKDLYLELWENKYIYTYNNNTTVKLDLSINVDYIKKDINNTFIISTSKWSFVYNIYKKELHYFSFFSDFVYFWDWYLWLVNKTDSRIIKNLWLSSIKNLIVYYNPKTKDKKIVYDTDITIMKLYKKDNKVFILDNNNETFELKNLE